MSKITRPKNSWMTYLAALAILFAVPVSAQEPTTFDELISLFKSKDIEHDSWSADYDMEMNMQGMTMSGKGTQAVKGERMVQNLAMDVMGQSMTVKSVIDEAGMMWSETNVMGQQMIIKMDMAVMAALGEEMSGLDFPGFGGGASMDMNPSPVEMLESLAEVYDAQSISSETVNGTEVYVIRGGLKEGVSEGFDPTGMMAQLGATLDRVELAFGKEDGLMRRMATYGPGEAPIMSMTYSNVEVDADLPDEEFAYTPPEGAQVMDMTEQMREMARQMESGDFDPNTFGTPEPKFEQGEAAPDFEGPGLHGKTVTLSDYRGKAVLIDFWATWCGPCVHEMPNVIAVYEKYRDKGFEIIGISLDEDRADLDGFLAERPGMTWPQIFEDAGWDSAIAELYGVEAIPTTYLIDGDGVIRAVDPRGGELEKAVAVLIGETGKQPE